MIGCGSATGQVIQPFIIFSGKQINLLWTLNGVNGSRFAVSYNGWIDQELFKFWLSDHFLPNASSGRPLFLLLDGHSSHFEPCTIQHGRDCGVVMLCLPPHTYYTRMSTPWYKLLLLTQVSLAIFLSQITTSVSIKCEANDHRSITGHCEEDLVADQSDGTSTTFTLEEELLLLNIWKKRIWLGWS